MDELIFRVDAFFEIGIGHLMRCIALGQAWKDRGGKVFFITYCECASLIKRLYREGFKVHPLTRAYHNAVCDEDRHYVKNILSGHKNAWVVLDGCHFDSNYQLLIKETGNKLLVVDDMANLSGYCADIILNQNILAEDLNYNCPPATKLLLGVKYVLLRREFLLWKKWNKRIPVIGRNMLITFGGSDLDNLTFKVIEALRQSELSRLKITAILGATNPRNNSLRLSTKQNNVCLKINTNDIPRLMAEADIAIIAAGVTLWELLYMRCPIITFSRNLAQRIIAQKLSELDVVNYQGRVNNMNSDRLFSDVQSIILSKQRREHLSQSAGNLIDGKGVDRVMSALL